MPGTRRQQRRCYGYGWRGARGRLIGKNHEFRTGLLGESRGADHHLAVTMEWATKEVKIFVDGSPMTFSYEGVPTYWTQQASLEDWLWGGNPDRSGRNFEGTLDEIRVSDVVRTQDWIGTASNNQDSPGTFYTVGGEEEFRALTKRSFTVDGTPITHTSTVARGTLIKFLIYINNRGGAATDVSVRDVLDAAFEYQSGTLKVNNTTDACAASSCTPVEEALIFSDVDATSALTDGLDGDVVSFAGGIVDAGDQNVGNGQLDIASGKVWALLFTVRVR